MYDELVKRVRQVAEEVCDDYDVDPYIAEQRSFVIEEAADVIEELICEAADEHNARLDAEERQRWIPVTERLPKYGTPVLAYGSRGGIFVAKYERARAEWDIDYWWKLNSSIHVCNPTHWMSLPTPPEEETR